MKLGIWTSYYIDLSPEKAVERLCSNGIYCAELSDEHGLELLSRNDDVYKTGSEFAEFLQSHKFEMPQGHLCLSAKICTDDTAIETLCRWIDLYEAIGIQNMVLHCDSLAHTSLTKEERKQKNVEKLRILADRIAHKDITVCLENLRPAFQGHTDLIDESADDLLDILERIGSPRFGICLDTGHLHLTRKDQRAFILTAGSKLKALHIADNDGSFDQHFMPFGQGNIDFAEMVHALREVGYDGIFNLEISGERHLPLELRDAKIAYIKAGFDYLLGL